jgi:hypothetical protein
VKFAEATARDALAFDPMPPSKWVTVDDVGIFIRVRYSEPLSNLLRKLPGGRWDAKEKRWQYPFASEDAIRAALPDIDRLGHLAQGEADRESAVRAAIKERDQRARDIQNRTRARERALSQPRALKHEFLETIPGRPRFAKAIEAVGDDARQFGFPSRCWIARLFGSDGRGGWARAYLSGVRDYNAANSTGSRGIVVTYFLEEGPIYEVSAPQSWRSSDRYFLRVVNGDAIRLTKPEVEDCLAK